MLRVAFGVWVIVVPVDLLWIARVPVESFNPRPGLFSLMTEPPHESVLIVLMLAKAILGAMVAVGLWTIPCSIALTFSMILASGISYSFSKVDHFILFEITPIFLALAGWGRVWSLDALWRRRRGAAVRADANGLPVLLFAMTIGWAMLSAAAPKLLSGWLDPDRFATRGYVARDIALNEKIGPLGPAMLSIDSAAFWKLMDYATVVVEAGLILFVFFPLLYRIWLLILSGFHVGVFLGLGISFLDYVLVYAVFFSPAIMWICSRIARNPFVRGHRRNQPQRPRALSD